MQLRGFFFVLLIYLVVQLMIKKEVGLIHAESLHTSARYSVDVERYRFGNNPKPNDDKFYPIPRNSVNKEAYFKQVDLYNPTSISKNPNRGLGGPQAFMPVLAKYIQTGDQYWGDSCITMLKLFHEELDRQIVKNSWVWQFEHPAALIPLYRKHLIAGGAMKSNESWFREMWLTYCRNLHVWDTEPIEWRGACHRSIPEAYVKGRAATWYPNIPEASEWARYSKLVFNDFWKTKDIPQNDTGYMMGPLIILVSGGDQWTEDNRVFTDFEMGKIWQRLLVEITPDGMINPYGPNGGWNSTADYRIAMLERISSITGDGSYRYGAHKLFNYLLYQNHYSSSGDNKPNYGAAWLISLAAIWANDKIKPIKPNSKSTWNQRGEAIRIPHTDKQLINKLLGNADFRKNRGHVCCSWHMTEKKWPNKLILRSGWEPGDLYGVIELHPTSFPSNPGGIMGLTRWGAPFTQIVTSKGASVENRLSIESLSSHTNIRYHSDKTRIDEFWRKGTMPDIRSEMTYFEETEKATYASLKVKNLDGLPVLYEREFIFAKNRFLATREIITFEESFKARIAPLWNTHNIGPQIGKHWANTFIHHPVASNGTRSMKCPPVDLLVWFAPKADCKLNIVDRLIDDPRAEACPNQLKYIWEGTPAKGEKIIFTQLLYPHPPYRSRPKSNNPNVDSNASYTNELEATAHASGIKVLRDDPEVTILKLELEANKKEWVLFNKNESEIYFNNEQTKKPFLYFIKQN